MIDLLEMKTFMPRGKKEGHATLKEIAKPLTRNDSIQMKYLLNSALGGGGTQVRRGAVWEGGRVEGQISCPFPSPSIIDKAPSQSSSTKCVI